MKSKCVRVFASLLTALTLAIGAPGSLWAQPPNAYGFATKTPIKHLVVIFQENISFDHYFATYPHAVNPANEPEFHAKDDTPRANNLLSGGLLDQNPNTTQPFRLDRTCPVTSDQNHSYTPEQLSFDHGLMDAFVQNTGSSGTNCVGVTTGTGIVMGYYDGNTTTAIWNYAQHYAMSDNSFSTMFGPSSPGAINLIAGTTAHANWTLRGTAKAAGTVVGTTSPSTLIGDARPGFDDCVTTDPGLQNVVAVTFPSTSKNVGDLLSAKGITWGWFQGGFKRTSVNGSGQAVCATHNVGLAGDDATTQSSDGDYIPHHEPFMYYQSTANIHHVSADPSMIGMDDTKGVNHQYDFTNGPCIAGGTPTSPCTAFNLNNDFWTALDRGNLPAVSFLKAGAFQDGHPGYSDPIDEQVLLVQTINRLMKSKEWHSMAVIIAYDDSDGWYDHVMDPVANQSDSPADDALATYTAATSMTTATGTCGATPAGDVPGRCGYGPRQPLIVISPYAKQNYIDHRVTDQSSILRFIEDNWGLGPIGTPTDPSDSSDVKAGTLKGLFDFDDRPNTENLLLDPATGRIVSQGHEKDDHDQHRW